jgi:hypothetical protein
VIPNDGRTSSARPDITISGNDQTRIFKVAGDVRP